MDVLSKVVFALVSPTFSLLPPDTSIFLHWPKK
mgnify:CR=1 FL=1